MQNKNLLTTTKEILTVYQDVLNMNILQKLKDLSSAVASIKHNQEHLKSFITEEKNRSEFLAERRKRKLIVMAEQNKTDGRKNSIK